MRAVPSASGRCHPTNDVRATNILTRLGANVHCSYGIPMGMRATCAAPQIAPLHWRLAPMSTLVTRLAGGRLLLQDDPHATSLGFICEHEACFSMGPLMHLLIVLRATVYLVISRTFPMTSLSTPS